MDDSRTLFRALAASYLARGEPLGWFDELYRSANGDASLIPWADLGPNPNLVAWAAREGGDWAGRRALVIGCGLGDDAVFLEEIGAEVTAFDLAPASIAWSRQRFPGARVAWHVANLLDPPAEWTGAFDFVFEAYTLQSMPAELRPAAFEAIAGFVAPGGRLLVIARGREPHEPAPSVPWPLVRDELEALVTRGLDLVRFEDYEEQEADPVRRFRVEFHRPL